VVLAGLVACPGARAESAGSQDVLFLHATGVLKVRLSIMREGQDYQAAWGDYLFGLFETLDADGSFDLSYQEFRAGSWSDFRLRRADNGLPIGEDLQFIDFDAKPTDDVITVDEFIETLAQCCCRVNFFGRSNPTAANDPLFARLDSDEDGWLGATELAGIDERLRWIDANDDELLTLDELRFAPRTGGRVIAIAIPIERGEPVGPVLAPPPGTPAERYAAAVIAYYDRSPEEDAEASQPKTLNPSELDLPDEEFQHLDANGDGELDKAELSPWLAALKPHVHVTAHFYGDLETPWELKFEDLNVADRVTVDSLENGKLRIAAPSAEVEMSMNGPPSTEQTERYAMRRFQATDLDKNDYLDEREAAGYGISAQFALIDTDGNKQIFLDELLRFNDRQLESALNRTDLEINDRGSTLFEIVETSSDQRLSVRELRELAAFAEKWDRNGDGSIAPIEVPRRFQVVVRPGTPRVLRSTGTLVTSPAAAASRNSEPDENDTPPNWFVRMDRNRDGDVSRREFLGPQEDFQRADADGDGLLSAKEAEALVSD